MKPLTTREWLEQERLSMLPHADFAADALLALEAWDGDDDDAQFRSAVQLALVDAGVADGAVPVDQVAGLLRMFLPC